MQSIIEEQYALAKHCGISISESSFLSDWERTAYVNLMIRDFKSEESELSSV